MAEKLIPGIDYIGITTPFYCNDGNGNFLVHKRSQNARDEQGAWDFGGGQLDFGEQIEDSVLREVAEEWGVMGQIQEQLPAHSMIRTLGNKLIHWIAIPFFIKVDVEKAKINEENKFDEMRVVRLDNLPEPFHSGVKQTMANFPEYFDKYK